MLLGTQVMTVEMSVNWASDNVSSVLMTKISVCKLNFKTPSEEYLMLDDFLETVLWSEVFFNDSWCNNSFLHGLILWTTEEGFFIWFLNDKNVLNFSFRNLMFSFSFSCCTHDLNEIICWWTNNHDEKEKIICDWSWTFSWTISCCSFLFCFCFVFNFTMKIASVALLMASTFVAVCSRVSLCNKIECQVLGTCSVTYF